MPPIMYEPSDAFMRYVKPALSSPGWMEDSSDVDSAFKLNKRELFNLIILAGLKNDRDEGGLWHVGYDTDGIEPNDGFLSNTLVNINVESKIIPDIKITKEKNPKKPLDSILSTFDKYNELGSSYGSGRTLVIFPNRNQRTLIPLHRLAELIGEDCSFDRVFTISLNREWTGTVDPFLVYNAYPEKQIAEVNFNFANGETSVPLNKIETF